MSKLSKIFIDNVKESLAGKSDYWLSKESGLSNATISRLMSGKMKPALDSVEAIAEALAVDAADLLKEEQGDIPPDIIKLLRSQDAFVYDAIRGMLKPLAAAKKKR